MRILCIHGQGASPQVFETQTGALIRELDEAFDHTISYSYLQGQTESTPFPGLANIFPPPFFNQWDPTSSSSVLSARAHLLNKLRADGPFDGVLAVSDGAALAATVMIHDAGINYHGHAGLDPTPASQHFRFAILIGAFPPYDSTGRRRLDVRLAGGPQIHCPTVHVVGNFDPFKSLISLSQGLCDRDKTAVVRWDGQHETPGWTERQVCRKVVSELKALQIEASGERINGIKVTNGINGMTRGEV